MMKLNIKENILNVNQEINDLHFINSDFTNFVGYDIFIIFLSIGVLGGVIVIYSMFYLDLLGKVNKDGEYSMRLEKTEHLMDKLTKSLLILMLIIISIMGTGVIIDTLNKNKIEKYVEENKEELRDMFTVANTYEITSINSLKYNYFITYKDDNKAGQILTDAKIKIKNSNKNTITFYQTQDTIKLINEMVLDGIDINPSLKKVIKYDLSYYEVESNTVNK